jgi:hypothetical protein
MNEYPENVQVLAHHVRRVLREWLPRAKESKDSPARVFAYVYGPGYRGVVCTLMLSKTGVKLGIPWGASFPDTHAVLRGAGKLHRHVPLVSIKDLQHPGIKELIAAASAACDERLSKA